MKKISLAAICVAMAVSSAFAGLFPARFDGLFGFKFGDRLVGSGHTVIPAGDGTLLATIEPKKPEFIFQQYFLCLIPKTNVIVGFCGASSFEPGEKSKCDKEYDSCREKVENHFKIKMKSIKQTASGVGDSMTVIRNCAFVFKDERTLAIQMLKDISGGYTIRFAAVDIKSAKSSVLEAKAIADSSSFEGLFGRKLGVKVPVSEDETKVANGLCLQVFEPEKKFLDYSTYAIQILPHSRRTCGIVAINILNERFPATECFSETCRLLEKKFNLSMTDISSNYDTSKPDEDGEQMIKAAAMTFPGSSRMISVECLKDVDENDFRVRLSALDLVLHGTLESEQKAAAKAKADAKALDAL